MKSAVSSLSLAAPLLILHCLLATATASSDYRGSHYLGFQAATASSAQAKTRANSQRCNYGVAIPAGAGTDETITCVCFAGYEPPHCLYTADSTVPVGLSWGYQAAEESNKAAFAEPFAPAAEDVVAAIAKATGADAVTMAYGESWSPPAASAMPFRGFHTRLHVPGSVAQQLSRDEAMGNLHRYAVAPALCEAAADAEPSTDVAMATACGAWALLGVQELADGPSLSSTPLYTDSWMRLYLATGKPSFYLTLPMCGWALASLAVAVMVGFIECCCTFAPPPSRPALHTATVRKKTDTHRRQTSLSQQQQQQRARTVDSERGGRSSQVTARGPSATGTRLTVSPSLRRRDHSNVTASVPPEQSTHPRSLQ